MGDENTFGIAGPVIDDALLNGSRESDGMNTSCKIIISKNFPDIRGYSSHNSHAEDDIVGVSELNTNF